MKRYILVFPLLFSFVYAQENSFSLSQAKAYAVEHSKEIMNAKLDMEKAEKKVWETTAQGLPQVSAKGEFQNFIDIPTTVVPAKAFNPLAPPGAISELKFGTNYNLKGTIQVSQLIFNGNYLVGLQAAKAFTNTSKILSEKQELETKQKVTDAYYTVLFLQENAKTLQRTLETLEKLYKETQILVNEKVLESTNASQIRLSVLQVKNGISKVNTQISVAKKLLKFQMGMPLETPIELTDSLDAFVQDELMDANSISSSDNVDYKVVESQLMLNRLSLKNTKANYLPSLAGFFSYQKNAQRYEFNFFDANKRWYPTTLWGVTLNVPIFSSGQRASQVSQAKLEVQKTENSLANVEQGIRLQISQASADYQNAVNNLTFQKEAESVAKEILDHTTLKFKEGTVSSIELSQAQNQYLSAQANLIAAKLELVKARLALQKLSNKL